MTKWVWKISGNSIAKKTSIPNPPQSPRYTTCLSYDSARYLKDPGSSISYSSVEFNKKTEPILRIEKPCFGSWAITLLFVKKEDLQGAITQGLETRLSNNFKNKTHFKNTLSKDQLTSTNIRFNTSSGPPPRYKQDQIS